MQKRWDMTDPYFNTQMTHRQVLVWTAAVRLQLDRWEQLVAKYMRTELWDKTRPDGSLIWQAQIEHHFCLIAARHLFRALELLDPPVDVDPGLRAELIAGRDLHEHWDENMPLFNRWPHQGKPPRRSGREFAQNNPNRTPYWWLEWNSAEGPKLLPKVPAPDLHAVLDRVQAQILQESPDFKSYLPQRPESPWQTDDHGNGWWPRQQTSE